MPTEKFKYDLGTIHGRFQILHNDHMKFIIAGKKLCKHLIVGITNPDPSLTKDHGTNPHRSTPVANPLTYYE
ncbi:MAG: nicotinate-nucleotide adenylyltransferase, partial [Candidatus Lokiarchaeota archaeon]|nr:nicotinate-nucleotide adenylyltransferase [Candidatus Lokiarchaeota archaeon]